MYVHEHERNIFHYLTTFLFQLIYEKKSFLLVAPFSPNLTTHLYTENLHFSTLIANCYLEVMN